MGRTAIFVHLGYIAIGFALCLALVFIIGIWLLRDEEESHATRDDD